MWNDKKGDEGRDGGTDRETMIGEERADEYEVELARPSGGASAARIDHAGLETGANGEASRICKGRRRGDLGGVGGGVEYGVGRRGRQGRGSKSGSG